MASDGAVVIDARMNTAQAEKDLARLKNNIEKTEDDIGNMQKKRDDAQKKSVFDGAELDAEKAKLEEMRHKLQQIKAIASDTSLPSSTRAEARAQIPLAKDEIADQQKRVSMLQSEWNKTQNAVEKYDEKIAESAEKLRKLKEDAGKLQKRLDDMNSPAGRLTKAFEDSGKSVDKLGKRIANLAKRVFVFTLITAALRKMREYLSKVLKTNDEAQAAFSRLKGALLTMAQPIIEVLIPALTALANILTIVVSNIARLFAAFSGKTGEESAKAAKGLYDEAEAIEGVGSAAKDAEGNLAGFDEINTIQTENASGGGGGGGASAAPDFGLDSEMPSKLKEIADLVLIIGAGLALWKLSGILPGSLGNVAKILGGILLTVGGLVLAWHGLSDAWENGVNWGNLIESIGGVAAAALGLYLLFGKMGAGIALVVGGIALLVTAFHDAEKNGWNLQNTLLAIAGIMGAGLGISLLVGSFFPLLVAGIASLLLALTNATGHGDELIAGIRQVIEGFKDFFVGIFTGDIERAIGGIGKIIDGLKTAVFAVLNGIKDSFNSFLTWLDEKTGGKLHGIIEFVRGLFNGMFDSVKSILEEIFNSVKQILTGVVKFISGIFTGDWDRAWEGVKDIFKGVWNGIIGFLESAVNLIVQGINWLIKQMNKVQFDVPDWVPGVGGRSIGINIPQLNELAIPRLAQGAVIPPNREFMAVLGDQKSGTNVEAPLNTIKQALIEALRESGGGGGDINITIEMDGTVVARKMVKRINDMTRQAGKPVLLY